MPFIMMLMHAYGRFVHRPEPPVQNWASLAFVAHQDASRPTAEVAAAPQGR